ncbi:hypothetical protein PLESTB_001789600 [Pleodorina starrii]|uniref:Mitochondrial inner membrane protease subunit 2 n=1 Tax=Pleodorina starrii TaxID=330485 RepID=A0A9W6C1B6_9CHLO|nr:hypothetical protein PLESTM_001760100 [Pleodorina starrii]GLC61672.1 hypothetical protein PLESTB_001789600 [Pleodorina starrii]GLC76507.1 hypothetical protein PLESTF_001790400 [Pleodorina starrii]
MASKPGGFLAFRYNVTKLKDAAEEFLFTVFQGADQQGRRQQGGLNPFNRGSPTHGSSSHTTPFGFGAGAGGSSDPSTSGSGGGGGGGGGGLLGVVQAAYRRARLVYDSPLTGQLYLTGPAMAPTLNWRGAKDASSRERLVVRLLRHPGPHNVLVGDVVAFHSPLALPDDATHVMVRRVAAVEGDEMVSSSPTDPPFLIPPGHCWVLADNAELRPEAGEVIDSRSYGHIPFSAVIGRVVYAASSQATHGPVRNNPAHSEAGGEDPAVVAAEVDVERIIEEEERAEEFGDGDDEGEEEEEEDGEEEAGGSGGRRDGQGEKGKDGGIGGGGGGGGGGEGGQRKGGGRGGEGGK